MNKKYFLILACVIAFSAAIASCSKDTTVQPTQPTEFIAKDSDFSGYRLWQQTTTPRKGPDPAGIIADAHSAKDSAMMRYIYINNTNASRGSNNEFSIGTILIKELRMSDGSVPMITAMVKRGGTFNSDHKGWEWFTADKDGKIMGRGSDLMNNMCTSCHSANAAKDYVFTK